MGIDDMPEMQVRNSFFSSTEDLKREELEYFGGKFLVLEDPNGRRYVAAGGGGHLSIYEGFREMEKREFNCSETFKPLDGGYIDIGKEKIVFSGQSDTYGKYEENIVRPIAERWVAENLPNYELVFE